MDSEEQRAFDAAIDSLRDAIEKPAPYRPGLMKGDGRSYLVRGVWPRFRDISDLGRSQIVNVKSNDTADTLQLEVLPRGFYWFTLGLARQHYAKVEDRDYLYAREHLAR